MTARYPCAALTQFATTLRERTGLDGTIARDVAEVLVEGDLLGHDTHGLALLAPYLAEIDKGGMARSGSYDVLNRRGASAIGPRAERGGPARGAAVGRQARRRDAWAGLTGKLAAQQTKQIAVPGHRRETRAADTSPRSRTTDRRGTVMTTTTAMRSLPRLARLLAAGAAVALPSLAHAAASSALTLGDPETYALLAAGLGMMAFMAGRRGNR